MSSHARNVPARRSARDIGYANGGGSLLARRSRWIGYLVTVLLEVALTAGLLALQPHFPLASYPISYVLVMMLVAYVFGEGPAALAFVIGLFAFDYYFVSPARTLLSLANTLVGWASLTAFLMGTLIVGFAAIVMRRSRRRIERLALELQNELAERKRAEEALARSEHQLRLIMDAGPTLIAYVDTDCRYRWVNKVYGQWFARASEEVQGRHVQEIMGETAWEKVRPYIERVLAGETVSFEEQLHFLIGPRWVHATYTPDLDESGHVRGFVVYAEDIGDRKRAEDNLLREKAFSESAINSLPGVFYLITREGRYLRWNSNFEKVSGYSSEEISAMLPLDFIPPEEKGILADAISQAFTEGQVSVEANLLSKSGERIPYYFIGRRMEVDDTAYLIGSGIDITDRKKAEEALQHQFRLLQRALLPAAPSVGPGYSVGSAYVPSFAGEEIGGDFYDVFQTEDGRVGILIGDVSGKGIEAASIGAATRNTIRAFAYDTSSPASALTHANSLLTRQEVAAGHFVTVFLAVLDLPTGVICYSSAGHPPPILRHPDGSMETLALGDVPVGVMGTFEYRETQCNLDPGDKIVLYTDGITEARENSKLFGMEGIEGILTEHGREGPESLVERILAAAGAWALGRLSDDVAIIVVEREDH